MGLDVGVRWGKEMVIGSGWGGESSWGWGCLGDGGRWGEWVGAVGV